MAAGPVGRQSSAATDIGLTAQVYSYSRAGGLFAGVALDGSAMTIDDHSNESFYGRPDVLPSDIIRSDAPAAPAPATQFIAALQRSAGTATASTSAQSAAPQPQPAAQPQGQPAQEGGLSTYPMEDAAPGSEPPQ